jgi:lipoprotein NlpI
MRGKVYQATGENELAIQDFNKAIQLDPGYLQLFYLRGISLIEI